MNLVDGVVLFMLLLGIWKGFSDGATKTILSLITWICAWFFGFKFASLLSPLFIPFADSLVGQISLAFLVISMTILITGHIICWFLLKILNFLKLTIVDKSLGAVLGGSKSLFKILIIISILFPILNQFNVWQQSKTAQILSPFTPVAKELLAETIKQVEL